MGGGAGASGTTWHDHTGLHSVLPVSFTVRIALATAARPLGVGARGTATARIATAARPSLPETRLAFPVRCCTQRKLPRWVEPSNGRNHLDPVSVTIDAHQRSLTNPSSHSAVAGGLRAASDVVRDNHVLAAEDIKEAPGDVRGEHACHEPTCQHERQSQVYLLSCCVNWFRRLR